MNVLTRLQLNLYKFSQKPRYAHNPISQWLRARMSERYVRLPFMKGVVWVSPGKNIGWHVFHSGQYEPTISQIICHFARAGYSFVDIGANLGLHTLAAAFHWQKATQRFIAFEPEPEMNAWLQKNCRENGLDFVEIFQIALADKKGELTLHVTTDINEGGHSLYARPNTRPTHQVPVEKLTTIMKKLNWANSEPVLVKLDVEGAESLVLRGGYEWLSQRANLALFCEISPVLLRKNGGGEQALRQLLQEIGCTHFYIVNDDDSFGGNGNLRNDYFNLLCLKGDTTLAQKEQLDSSWFLTTIPPNAPNFVDWQAFSTQPLHPLKVDVVMNVLGKKSIVHLGPFQSAFPLIGPAIAWFRTRWGNVAARWLVQDVAAQQNEVNHLLAKIVHDLDARLAAQDQEAVELRHDLGELTAQIVQLNRRLETIEAQLNKQSS